MCLDCTNNDDLCFCLKNYPLNSALFIERKTSINFRRNEPWNDLQNFNAEIHTNLICNEGYQRNFFFLREEIEIETLVIFLNLFTVLFLAVVVTLPRRRTSLWSRIEFFKVDLPPFDSVVYQLLILLLFSC